MLQTQDSLPHENAKQEIGFSEAPNSRITSPLSDFITKAIPLLPTTCKLRPLFAKDRAATPLQKGGENITHL